MDRSLIKMRRFLLCSVLVVMLARPAFPSSISWQADMTTTVISSTGRAIASTGKIYVQGSQVRFEPENADEIDLYNFDQMKNLRLFPSDRIYFENRLTPARRIKAVQEGWLSGGAPSREKRILLREGTFKEERARLYLFVFEEKGERLYSLRWMNADESAPLQIIYPASSTETVIIDYDHRRGETIDGSRFAPPADFLSVHPY